MRLPYPPLAIGLLGVVLFSGCAQPRPFDDLWVERRPYRAGVDSARPPEDVLQRRAEIAEAPPTRNPTGPITLREAVGLALRQNPALRASGWAAAAAEADAVQMARPPNPAASLSVENFAGPDAGETFQRQTLRISQVIELSGKRVKRQALGQATQRLRAWDYEQRRLDVASQTAERYLAVVISQRRVEIARRQLDLARASEAIVDDRVRSSVAPGLERDQAKVRVTLSEIALAETKQALAADRAELAAAWGAEAAQFGDATGELDSRVAVPPLEDLKQRAAQSPAVARWDDEIRQKQAALDLERAGSVPDPSVGAGVRYFSDANDAAGVAEVSWPIPLLDDNRSAVLSARLKLAQAHALREQARARINADLTRAHARLRGAEFSVKSLRDTALPSARSAYDAALASYDAGQSDYLTVLDAQRTLLDIKNRWLDAELAYHRSLIELEHITAHALQDLDAPPRAE
jgi:cobalt-zinc-cadmium efflux system outer membrane protein